MLRFLRFKPRLLNFPRSGRPRSAEENSRARSAVARYMDRILICLFAGAIAIPAVWGLGFSEPAVPSFENRNPAPPPATFSKHGAWKKFPTQFEQFFNDRLGFRRNLLDYHARSKMNWFQVSSSPTVAIGPNGWLFLKSSTPFDNPVERRPSQPEHARRWCACLKERQDWLAERGIRYLVVIAPEKDSIYPEEFPRSMRYVHEEPILDDFLKQAEILGLPVVDLRPALLEAKNREPLYFKYDTHWNGVGSWYGAMTVLSHLKQWYPDFTVPKRSDYSPDSFPFPEPNLARNLAMNDVHEAYYYLKGGMPSTARPVSADFGRESSLRLEPNGPEGYKTDHRDRPRALFLHDSFALYMLGHMTEQFQELNCLWSYQMPKEFIERTKPDLVIQEIVERHLKSPPKNVLGPQESP